MQLAISILATVVAAAPTGSDAHTDYIKFHKEWLRIHDLEDGPANAPLVIDPRKQAMWIEVDGKIPQNSTLVKLPDAVHWYAFHITERGIVERAFPVRLTRPRSAIPEQRRAEQLWIVGMSKDRSWQFSFAAHQSGQTFHVGSGSRIDQIRFQYPERPAAANSADAVLNFVAPPVHAPQPRRPQEQIRKKDLWLRVARYAVR